jgi:transcriptional regulator with XRE-family HTH domain
MQPLQSEPVEFHVALARIMSAGRWDQKVVAKGIGVSETTFSNWATGKYIPRFDIALKIADFLGVDVLSLAGREREPSGLTEAERELIGIIRTLGAEEAKKRLLLAPESIRITRPLGASQDPPPPEGS